MKPLIPLLLLFLLLLAGCAAAPQTGDAAALPLADCTLSGPGMPPVKARCGTLSVAEDPANPSGKQIELHIAVVPAVSRDPAPDPLFLLAGGPGQAAAEAFLPLLGSLDRIRFKRDLIMVDQRGTGQSSPLDCPEPAETPEVLGAEQPVEEQLAELAACRAALGVDPALYGTQTAASDLDQVREALGYEQVNLLGVSYGTRAALTYARLYPERARSLVLDGVVPPGWALGQATGPDAERALEMIFERCASDSACAETFPGLAGQFDDLLAGLEAGPVEVTVPDPVDASPVRVLLTPRNAATTLRLMSYSDLYAALIPLAVQNAGQGDYQILASHYLLLIQSLDESLGMGMYFSVICAEDEPLLPDSLAGGGYFDPQLDLLREGCQNWRGGQPAAAAAAEAQPGSDAQFEVPALLISGQADPVTPPENAERLARQMPNSARIIAPGLGHNNFYVGCIPNLVLDFLEDASPANLDTACVEDIQPMPFFLSPTGPQP